MQMCRVIAECICSVCHLLSAERSRRYVFVKVVY